MGGYHQKESLATLIESKRNYKMTQDEITEQAIALIIAEAHHDGDKTITRKQALSIIKKQRKEAGIDDQKKKIA